MDPWKSHVGGTAMAMETPLAAAWSQVLAAPAFRGAGAVHFIDAAGGRQTRRHVAMVYKPAIVTLWMVFFVGFATLL